MIVLKNVSFQYEGCEEGVHAIDLTVYDGECVVLTGPSGGGKTTLTRLINGLAPSYYRGDVYKRQRPVFPQEESINIRYPALQEA